MNEWLLPTGNSLNHVGVLQVRMVLVVPEMLTLQKVLAHSRTQGRQGLHLLGTTYRAVPIAHGSPHRLNMLLGLEVSCTPASHSMFGTRPLQCSPTSHLPLPNLTSHQPLHTHRPQQAPAFLGPK